METLIQEPIAENSTADEWNRAHPVGTRVRLRRRDGRFVRDTVTSGPAYATWGGTLVVHCRRTQGHVRVDQLEVREDSFEL